MHWSQEAWGQSAISADSAATAPSTRRTDSTTNDVIQAIDHFDAQGVPKPLAVKTIWSATGRATACPVVTDDRIYVTSNLILWVCLNGCAVSLVHIHAKGHSEHHIESIWVYNLVTKAGEVAKGLLRGACTGIKYVHHTLSFKCVMWESWCKTVLSEALCVVFPVEFWVLVNFVRHNNAMWKRYAMLVAFHKREKHCGFLLHLSYKMLQVVHEQRILEWYVLTFSIVVQK